jgi:hypothetical protein
MAGFSSAAPKTGLQRFPEVNIPGGQIGECQRYLFGTYLMEGSPIYPATPGQMLYHKQSTGSGGKGGFGGGVATGADCYWMNFAIAYCVNPIYRLLEIRIDDKPVWAPLEVLPGITADSLSAGGYKAIDTFNKDVISGKIRIYFGADDAAVDPFFLNPGVTANRDPSTPVLNPAWPGLCWAMFEDFQVGTSPSVPKIRIRAEAAQSTPLGDPDNNRILTPAQTGGFYYEANAVHVVADVLSNLNYGGELAPSDFEASWLECAQQCFDEGLGVSGYIDRADKGEQLSDDLLDHIGGVIVGRGDQWGLRLIRRTYSFAEALAISEEHFKDVEIVPAAQTEAATQISVEFNDQTRQYGANTVDISNVAASITTSVHRRERISFKYYTAQAAALVAAQTKAPLLITPPDKIRFKLSRYAGLQLEAGDAIVPSYSKCQNGALDGTRIFRITELDRPLSGLYLTVEAFEECVTMLAGAFADRIAPADPAPTGILDTPLPQLPLELPWDIAGADLRVTHLAARMQAIYSNFELRAGTQPDQFDLLTPYGEFVQAGTLAAPYSWHSLSVDDHGLTLTPALPADLAAYWGTASVVRAQLFQNARLMVLFDPVTDAHEICSWQVIEPSAACYRVRGICRGLYDTAPQNFPTGALVFLMSAPSTIVGRQPGWGNGVTVHCKAVPYNAVDSATAGAMPSASLTLRERAQRPFPVSNLRANGLGATSRPTYADGQPIRFDWIPRTRGKGIGYFNPGGPFDAHIPTEGDFVLRLWSWLGSQIAVGGSFVVPATQTHTDPRGVERVYCDIPPNTFQTNPDGLMAVVTARASGWESLYPQTITVERDI